MRFPVTQASSLQLDLFIINALEGETAQQTDPLLGSRDAGVSVARALGLVIVRASQPPQRLFKEFMQICQYFLDKAKWGNEEASTVSSS